MIKLLPIWYIYINIYLISNKGKTFYYFINSIDKINNKFYLRLPMNPISIHYKINN